MGSKEVAKSREDSGAAEPLEAVWHLVHPDAETEPTAEELVEALPFAAIPFNQERYNTVKRSIAGLPEEVQPRARQTLLATLLEGRPQTDRSTYSSYNDRDWHRAIYAEVNDYFEDYSLEDASSQEVTLLQEAIGQVFANWSSLELYSNDLDRYNKSEAERNRFRAMEYGLLQHPSHPDHKDPLTLLAFANRHYLDKEWYVKAFEDAAQLMEQADLSDEDTRNQLFYVCFYGNNLLSYQARSAKLSIVLSVAEQSDRSPRYITETRGRVFKREVSIEQMPEFELRREIIGQTIDFIDLLKEGSDESFEILRRYIALYPEAERSEVYSRINEELAQAVYSSSDASGLLRNVLPVYERFAPSPVYEELRQRMRQTMLGKLAREGAKEA